jgi:malonyl-CoA O-methyltransferase
MAEQAREKHRLNILPLLMSEPTSTAPRDIDLMGVRAFLRRLAAAPTAPWLHGEVARRLGERLQIVLVKPAALLDWWGFGGASAEVLHGVHPNAQRIVVEPNPALRERSAGEVKTAWWSARHWLRPAASVIAPEEVAPASVQLVWANMMVHHSFDPAALFARWHRALAVDGFVMFSCLGPDTLRELRALYARLGWAPAMADLVDMHDLGDMLVHAGFADPVMDQELITLTWESPEALLAELRGLGVNAAPARFAGLRTPRWKRRLLSELQALAGADGRIALTFEVAYGHAFKAAPRIPLAAETTVSLDDMRNLVRTKSHRGSSR